jgi:UDP-N-acetylglucosamine 4,6-dehydratase
MHKNNIMSKFFGLSSLSLSTKRVIILGNDFIVALICWLVFGPPMATFIASEFSTGIFQILISEWLSFFVPTLISLSYLYFFGFYRSLIKFFDSKDSIFLSMSGSIIFGFSWSTMHVYQFELISTAFLSIVVLQGFLLAAVFYAFINLTRDLAKYILYPHNTNDDAKNIVIYGAGQSGNELYQSILLDPSKKLIAFFDDSKNLKDREINNIPILGSFSRLEALKSKFPDLEVLLAIPGSQTEKRRAIISRLEKIKVSVRTVPSFHELISDQKKMADIQYLSLDDLLPRTRVSKVALSNMEDKIIFISGAGGSIGSEIARQILESAPKALIAFDISEYNLFQLEQECRALKTSKLIETEIIPILGDIRDVNNLSVIFKKYRVHTVYHAAAYKHVPLVEDENNIIKACENNILGTLNLAKISIEHAVTSFVMISTDKAVRPSNIMGASKRMAETIIQSLDSQQPTTKFSMVRFGNVLNSSGSVIPTFVDQIAKGGPVTVTDKEVTRYFMTIPEASNLVIQASQMACGGEVFILDMGEQLKIYDLAKKLIHLSGRNIASEAGEEGIEILEVGLRPGEKMYEELLISGDLQPTHNPKIFKSNEVFPSIEIMEKVIHEIQQAISSNCTAEIMRIFTSHVEGYKS